MGGLGPPRRVPRLTPEDIFGQKMWIVRTLWPAILALREVIFAVVAVQGVSVPKRRLERRWLRS